MTPMSHDDALNERCRTIIEAALSGLRSMGMSDHEAARLLLIQGAIRLGDRESTRAVMMNVLDNF